MKTFDLHRGESALIVSIPHDGREVPDAIACRFTPEASALPDTDWHVRRLYDFLEAMDATVLSARLSRYVVDLNRPADQAPLYPGRWETALVPTHTLRGHPIYRDAPPDSDEIEDRTARYWRPYHDALETELGRIVAQRGFARLWEAHSIPSQVSSLFDGRLPDLSLGTDDGRSCRPAVADRVVSVAEGAVGFTWVRDGRFKGGYITRHYGRPSEGVDALQLELVQSTYMREGPPFEFDEDRARRIRPVLREMLDRYAAAPPELSPG